MKKFCLCLLMSFACSVCVGETVGPVKVDTGVANLTVGEQLTIASKVLGEERQLNVYLPTDYAQAPDKKFPVIYLLDGGLDEDFLHVLGLTQFASFSWIKDMPQAIVVGIVNKDRRRDFTYPSKNELDGKDFPTSGHSAAFIRFLQDEAMPMINQRYRVSADASLIGQSLGGLLATEILFKKPALFERYAIISPSLWWDDEALLALSPQAIPVQTKVYIAVGKEGEVMERLARALYAKCQAVMPGQGAVQFRFYDQLDHGDTLHLALYDGFKFLFSDSVKLEK